MGKNYKQAMADEGPKDLPTGKAPNISTDAKEFFIGQPENWGERLTPTFEQGETHPIPPDKE